MPCLRSAALAATMATALAAPILLERKQELPQWSILPGFQATIAFGASFTGELTGSVSGAQDGFGAAIWQTVDGGNSFQTSTIPDTALMFLDVSRREQEAVATGVFLPSHSSDGARSFTTSLSGSGGSQSVEPIAGTEGGFAITGGTNQLAITRDGGATFPTLINDVFTDGTPPRYGAFPSATTWYVTGGSWPSNQNSKENLQKGTKWMAEHLKMTVPTPQNESQVYGVSLETVAEVSEEQAQEYYGNIARTTDGGATWETVFEHRGDYYFNEISCFDELRCVAVGEASAGPNPGARVFVTGDGGVNWDLRIFETGENVMAVHALSTGEAWVATSRFGFDPFGFVSKMWYSADFGATFTIAQELEGFNPFSLSILPNGRVGFSAGMLTNQQCAVATMRQV